MALTPTQLTALKADILANTNPVVVQALSDGNAGNIAAWYNLASVPDYWIFRDFVPSDEIRDAIDAQDIADITTADRGRALDLLTIRQDRGFSGENVRDRSAWDDIFSAQAGDNSQQAIMLLWTRIATNAEKVFALSTGTGSSRATADTVSFRGSVSQIDISAALNT